MLKLYGFKKVNALARGRTRDLRVLWALEELEVPYELVGMDQTTGELNSETFHNLNPLEQMPVIIDDGVVLSESASILIYLAKKAGKLIPSDLAGESQVIRWCFVAVNSVEIPLMNILMMDWSQDNGCRNYREFLASWANRHLSNLERWLNHRQYVATDNFTIADILMVHVLAVVEDESLLKPFSRVRDYRDRCLARPAWQSTIDSYYKNVEAG